MTTRRTPAQFIADRAVHAAALHAWEIGGSMGLGLWRTQFKHAHGVDLPYALLVRAVLYGIGQLPDDAPVAVGYPLTGVGRAQWDADPRHLIAEARQIEAALAAGRYGSARWTAYAMRCEETKARWIAVIEEAEKR